MNIYYVIESLIINNSHFILYSYLDSIKDLNKIVSNDGDTLLHFIVQQNYDYDNLKLFKYLINKIDPNIKNKFGLSVYDYIYFYYIYSNYYYKYCENIILPQIKDLSLIDLILMQKQKLNKLQLLNDNINKYGLKDVYFKFEIFYIINDFISKSIDSIECKELQIFFKIIKQLIEYDSNLIRDIYEFSFPNKEKKLLLKIWKYIFNNTNIYDSYIRNYSCYESLLIEHCSNIFVQKILIFLIKKYKNIYMIIDDHKSFFEMTDLVFYPIILKQHIKNGLILLFHKYQYLDINLTQRIKPYLLKN